MYANTHTHTHTPTHIYICPDVLRGLFLSGYPVKTLYALHMYICYM